MRLSSPRNVGPETPFRVPFVYDSAGEVIGGPWRARARDRGREVIDETPGGQSGPGPGLGPGLGLSWRGRAHGLGPFRLGRSLAGCVVSTSSAVPARW